MDAASHIGVARDLYAWMRLNNIPCKFHYPDISAYKDGDGNAIPIDVEDATAAPRYTGITIRGAKVGPSPEWLQKKLISIGLRPIDNIVDVSNFVLFELGQPLHTFDASKIIGGKVIVRRAKEGEKLVTLDGVERTLHATDIVIIHRECLFRSWLHSEDFQEPRLADRCIFPLRERGGPINLRICLQARRTAYSGGCRRPCRG